MRPIRKRGESANYALTQEQVQRALSNCRDNTDRVIIGTQIWLGLRVSELVHLRADWITEQGDLKIPLQMACNCSECTRIRNQLWTPKTRAGARTLPIPKQLRKNLSELLKVKPYGLGLSRQAIYYRTKTILKQARVKFKSTAQETGFPHCLRSTCASMLVEGGMSEFALTYFMGWSDINMAKTYVQMFRIKPRAIEEARAIFG